jgi:hypothetical protein
MLRVLAVGAGAAAAGATSRRAAAADTVSAGKKNRAPYNANSPEVQTFYRVNRYPAK